MTVLSRKVVHYKKDAFLSTTETWIYGQIRCLSRYRPLVYCHGVCHLDLYPVPTIRSAWGYGRPGAGCLSKITREAIKNIYFPASLFRDRPDVVHAHYGFSGYDFLFFRKLFGIPLVTTFYGFDVDMLPQEDPRWLARYQRLFAEGDLFLVEGSVMKSRLVMRGCDEKKVVVQHLGDDLEKIRFEPRAFRAGEPLGILLSGSFREKKGFPYAIEAIGRFHARRPEVNLKVTIVGDSNGQPRDEREKRRIIDAVKAGGLEPFVEYLGYQPHDVFIRELYKHHIFLSPSVTALDGDTEGGAPVSIIEASASGMPILSTRQCDIPEVVRHGESGYLAPERDAGALAENLAALVDRPEALANMGRAGREHVEKNYCLQKQGVALENIYDRVVGDRTRALAG